MEFDGTEYNAEHFMNYTDSQLKQALAKMLPELIDVNPTQPFTWYWKNKTNTCDCKVLDTELLHLCWLVEETLSLQEQQDFTFALVDSYSYWKHAHATWQQRVQALCKVKQTVIS